MQSRHAAIENQLVAQVVATPEFKKLITLPVFAWQHVLLVAGVYAVVFGGLVLYFEGMISYITLLLTSALARYASFTPLHDSVHNALSRNQKVNDWMGALSAQLLFPGMNTEFYRFLHLEHHRHTGDEEKDPDELTGSPDLIKRWRTVLFFDWHLAIWFIKHRESVPARQRLNNYLTLVSYIVFHGAFLLSPFALEFLMLWVLPTRLGIAFVTYVFASIQHPTGVLQTERPLQATRMVSDGLFLRHFSLGQSEHLMHHMFPRVPFYNYHRAWRLSQNLFKRRELVWSGMFPFFTKAGRTMPTAELDTSPLTIPVIIDGIEQVSDDVKSYTFRSVDGKALPDYQPGAHIDVHAAEGFVRQYSLTGLSRPSTYNIAVKCESEGRGGSRYIHENFELEQTVCVGVPRNLFALSDTREAIQLVAGGIGITPLLAMAEALHKSGREFTFHICAREAAFQPFADYLKRAPYAERLRTYFDNEGDAIQAADLGPYEKGRELYMCGPAGFMNYVSNLAAAQGYPQTSIHFEHFSAEESAVHENKAFTVELAQSGKTFKVEANETLLDALQGNGVAIPASCMQGICSTCECRVLEGEIDHRDKVLSAQQKAQGVMTACVSRARNKRLVIDL